MKEKTERKSGRKKRININFLAISLIFLIFIPNSVRDGGGYIKLEENLYMVVVKFGYQSTFSEIAGDAGLSYPLKNKNTDRYIAGANADGLAKELLGHKRKEGLFLEVESDSKAFKAGLRSKDIVKKISYERCKLSKEVKNIYVKWYYLNDCDGNVIISRYGEKDSYIKIKKGDIDGTKITKVLNDKIPEIPKRLNSTVGTSGSMALSLFYLDQQTEGNLFSEDRVSATGAIDSETGHYKNIASLDKKFNAVRENRSTIFFIPKHQDTRILEKFNSDDLQIVKVSSLEEIVNILCLRGAQDSICRKK